VEIAFVRHAQPAWFEAGFGVGDPGLTELGSRQAAEAAELLGEHGPWEELLVSPLMRARQTAEPIAEATGLEPQVVEGLAEISGTDFSGTPEERVLRAFARERHRPYEEWWDGFPGGESFHDFHDRIAATMLAILTDRGLRRHDLPHLWDLPDDDPGGILVVAHGGTDAVSLGWLLGLEPVPWEWERFKSPHASVSRVAVTPLAGAHIMALISFGETGHLSRVTY
jgi:probable phosphoglycerate mutase